MSFAGFTGADFDAYEQQKWQSNKFNLERLQVKEKLAEVGRQIADSLHAKHELQLETELSVEHPALWNQHSVRSQYVAFGRDAVARADIEGLLSKQRSMSAMLANASRLGDHVLIWLHIDNCSLEIALRLPATASVDRDNLRRRSAEFFQRERLLSMIDDCADSFEIGFDGEAMQAVRTVGDEDLQRLLGALAQSDHSLVIRRTYTKDEAISAAADFVDHAAEQIGYLVPIWRYIAWAPDNDHLQIEQQRQAKQAKVQAKGLGKNDAVRIVRGMFRGRLGTVEAVDSKGGLKVRLGNMTIKLEGADVTRR